MEAPDGRAFDPSAKGCGGHRGTNAAPGRKAKSNGRVARRRGCGLTLVLGSLALGPSPEALAEGGLHPFAGVLAGALLAPFTGPPQPGAVSTGSAVLTAGFGLEAGVASDLGFQLRLRGFGALPQPPTLYHLWGGTLDLRYVIDRADPRLAPYLSLGGGYGRGNDGAGRVGGAIFELGAGLRVRLDPIFSIGAEVEWVNFTTGALECALGVQL